MTSTHPKIAVFMACLLAGCTVGPAYHRPSAETPAAFKELTPGDFSKTEGWKVAQPSDDALRGKWWEIFNDPQLNALEEKVNVSNQTLAASVAGFLAAHAMVLEARSQLFPTLTTSPGVTVSRPSARVAGASGSSSTSGSPTTTGSGTATTTGAGASSATPSKVKDYNFPFDATWQPDFFGRVRNMVDAAAYAAQASAADVENTRLSVQAELASDYFQLRGQDALKALLDATVVAYQQALDLTVALYETGVGSDESVAQAETQLEAAKAQAIALGIQRAQFEHAIAMLTGQPASTFSFPAEPLDIKPPAIPFGMPSELLERRPDIASAERLVAQANAQIGVAQAAYFPTVTLSAVAGFESSTFANWLSWPSRYFSIGTTLAETLFDAGLRRATVMQYRAQYDQTIANYRQAVLTAFQQVEDNLSSLRVLSAQHEHQDAAVKAAQRTLKLALDRYKLGLDPYLNVITAQTALLTNQQTEVNIRIQQMTASSGLIMALGGGWDAAQLPTPEQVKKLDAPKVSIETH
jgi:NodT family efflux transporter outer membrane factor (OMF) lipoprotein